MKYISDEMRWFQAVPIVNKAIEELYRLRIHKAIEESSTPAQEIKLAIKVELENNKLKLAFNRMLIG